MRNIFNIYYRVREFVARVTGDTVAATYFSSNRESSK